MALTFIGWSSWEVKLAMLDLLGMPPTAAWLQRTTASSAQQQQVLLLSPPGHPDRQTKESR